MLGPDNVAADEETGSLLAEFTEAGLGDTKGRTIWRKLMATSTYPFVSELRSQGREEGVAEGRAQDIERLLDKRGIAMTPADRERISSCRDGKTLDTWLDRVLTIRQRLSSLATRGARVIQLDRLDVDAALELLSRTIGSDRALAEPHAARELVELCGRLPLALCIAGARLAARSRWPVSEMTEAMMHERERLAALTMEEDMPVRTALDLSYGALPTEAARLYRLMGLFPGSHFDSGVAAAIAAVPRADHAGDRLRPRRGRRACDAGRSRTPCRAKAGGTDPLRRSAAGPGQPRFTGGGTDPRSPGPARPVRSALSQLPIAILT